MRTDRRTATEEREAGAEGSRDSDREQRPAEDASGAKSKRKGPARSSQRGELGGRRTQGCAKPNKWRYSWRPPVRPRRRPSGQYVTVSRSLAVERPGPDVVSRAVAPASLEARVVPAPRRYRQQSTRRVDLFYPVIQHVSSRARRFAASDTYEPAPRARFMGHTARTESRARDDERATRKRFTFLPNNGMTESRRPPRRGRGRRPSNRPVAKRAITRIATTLEAVLQVASERRDRRPARGTRSARHEIPTARR